MPDRPEAFGDYQLPIDPVLAIGSPSDNQPGETRLGIRIEGNADAPVTSVDLARQLGKPKVVLVGELYGVTVIVRHTVAVAGNKGGEQPTRDYLMIYGNLAKPGPRIVSGGRRRDQQQRRDSQHQQRV